MCPARDDPRPRAAHANEEPDLQLPRARSFTRGPTLLTSHDLKGRPRSLTDKQIAQLQSRLRGAHRLAAGRRHPLKSWSRSSPRRSKLDTRGRGLSDKPAAGRATASPATISCPYASRLRVPLIRRGRPAVPKARPVEGRVKHRNSLPRCSTGLLDSYSLLNVSTALLDALNLTHSRDSLSGYYTTRDAGAPLTYS